MGDNPTRTPYTRSRWPEYFDGLRLDPAAHQRVAARFIDNDSIPNPARDWARRFDISRAGWALADVYGQGGVIGRFVVYPVNISLNGAGILHFTDIPVDARICVHFDRLVEGPLSLQGVVRRNLTLEGFPARLVGVAWSAESRQALIDHLGPAVSDAAMREAPQQIVPEQEAIDAAYRSLYAENRLGNWAATVSGD
ncbi:MAG TPA: hypothetical protein VHC70_05250 [Phycisphaerales bacterium]|jgi:hypothetical protein|nr:hypothetical protein [Phycisphaerales bacterium]